MYLVLLLSGVINVHRNKTKIPYIGNFMKKKKYKIMISCVYQVTRVYFK